MSKSKVGVLHPGQMGVVVAATMRNSGHEVFWASEGRSRETCRRAADAGLTDAISVGQLCEICSVLVSVCPPEFAEGLARAVAGHSFRGLYLDANAISPQRTRRIGELLSGHGAAFLDGCIIGMPTSRRGETWLYVSGENAGAAASFFAAGPLECEVIGGEIGQASALKMCFAAHSKGTAALLAAAVGAAEALGVRGALERQWSRSGPNVARVAQSIQRAAPKAWRFVGEMKEIASTFEAAGIRQGFPNAAEEIFQQMADFKNANEPDLASVLRRLRRN